MRDAMVELLLTALLVGFGLLLPWTLALSKRLQVRGEVVLPGRIGWRPVVHSLLAYVLAFNLTFFLQELFLASSRNCFLSCPRRWCRGCSRRCCTIIIAGSARRRSLTCALAILLSGLLFAAIASRQARPSFFVLWMAFHGLFQSLPQFVVGAISEHQDVGRAYDYLVFGWRGEAVLALAALAAIPVAGQWLGARFLSTAWEAGQVDNRASRFGYLLRLAGMPALAAIPIIILYRVPREPIEVLAPPVLVALLGCGWLQLAAFAAGPIVAKGKAPDRLVSLLVGAAGLLAFFQLVLRPGISF